MLSILKIPRKNTSLPSGHFKVKTAAELIAKNGGKVEEIKSLISVPTKYWKALYLPCIENLAELCQDLPASEYHHHSHIGGLLEHTLDVCLRSLKYRQGNQLPVGGSPDEVTQESQLWTYAIFTAAMIHDIGKPLSDQAITLYDSNHKLISDWNPLLERMYDCKPYSYTFEYIRGSDNKRNYHLHELTSPLFINSILPKQGLAWLSSNNNVFQLWLRAIYATNTEENIVYELAKRSDQDSVAANLNGMETVNASNTPIKSLQERIAIKLRQLIEGKTLIVNDYGCQGWIKDGFAWMVVKPTIDGIRDSMQAEGQTGMPHNNIRVMEEIQGSGHVASQVVGEKHIATFTINISHPDWPKSLNGLTTLKFPLSKIWPSGSKKPTEFGGAIEVVSVKQEPIPAKPAAPTQTSQAEVVTASTDKPAPKPEKEPRQESPAPQQPKPAPQPKETAAEPAQTAAAVEYPSSGRKRMATEFLKWVSDGLSSKDTGFLVNDRAALVHIVPEGVFLVSPKIFKQYDSTNWSAIQKGLNSLKVTAKDDAGKNIFEYTIGGNNKIRGMLIDKPSEVLGLTQLPSPNPLLKRAPVKKAT